MKIPQTPPFSLSGKRALVTGGSKGIGFACAVALAQAGARVWIAARDPDSLASAVERAAREQITLTPLALDITQSTRVEESLSQLPAMDILVNSAGLARHQPFMEVSDENYDAVMAVNVRATFL